MKDIMMQLIREGVRTASDIDRCTIRRAMKQIGLDKLYKHEPQIMFYIANKKPLSLTPAQEEQVRRMYSAVIPLFIKYKPPNKRNFISVSYWMHEFCRLLGWNQFRSYFSLLKDDEKNQKHHETWRKICHDLDWECKP